VGRRTKSEIADDIRMQEAQLARTTGFGQSGSDSAYVADREQFNGYTHQQIWDRVHEKISPDALGQIASHWGDHAQKLHDLFDAFGQGVKREFAEWSGAFADSAQQSTNTFLTASSEAHGTATTVQRLMELNSSAAQTVRAAIPPPAPPYKPDPDPAKEAADGGARLRTYQSQTSAVQAEVQDTMNFVYNPTIPASGDAVPRFVPPPAGPRVQPGPVIPGPPGTSSQPKPGTGPSAQGKGGGSGDTKPGDQTQGNGTAPNAPQDHTQPATASAASAATTPSSFDGLPTATAPAAGSSTVPTNAGLPAGTGLGGPGGIGGTGIGPIGSGTPEASGGAAPVGGGRGPSVPGEPIPSAAQANTARTSPTTASAAQRPMSGGMPHAGHGGKGESEAERSKTSPEYLHRQYEELMELAPAGPGVIGINPADEDGMPETPPPPPYSEPPHTSAEPARHAPARMPSSARNPAAAPSESEAPAVAARQVQSAAPPPQVPATRSSEPPPNREGYVGRGPMGDG
jgi:hypothetical protein